MMNSITYKEATWLRSVTGRNHSNIPWLFQINVEKACSWATDGHSLFIVGDYSKIKGDPDKGVRQVVLQTPHNSGFIRIPVEAIRVFRAVASIKEHIECRVIISGRNISFIINEVVYGVGFRVASDVDSFNPLDDEVSFLIDKRKLLGALSGITEVSMAYCKDSETVYIKGFIGSKSCIALVKVLRDT